MTKGRKPTDTAEILDPVVDEAAGAQALATLRESEQAKALAVSQHEASVRAVAAQVGYLLPGDCPDPDLIQRDVAANMRRTVESMIEVGRGLIVLREACGHGEFMARLDVLGFEARAAQRYMQVVRKFANASTSTHLIKAAGTQSKLLEMIVLDDEQIEELELTGQTGELSLDDVATMSVKELRAKLRELKADLKATEEISAEKTQRIEKLQREAKRIAAATSDEVLADLQTEATRMANDVRGGILGELRQALVALNSHGESRGERPEVFMAGLVGQLAADLASLRTEFDLPEISGDDHAWIKD